MSGQQSKLLDLVKTSGNPEVIHQSLRELAKTYGQDASTIAVAEEVLRAKRDDWSLQGAIYALCVDLPLAARYRTELEKLVEVENWEELPDSSIAALSVLGSILQLTQDPALYRFLNALVERDVHIYENDSASFHPVHLESVVRAIDRGIRGEAAIIRPVKVRSPNDLPADILQELGRRTGSSAR